MAVEMPWKAIALIGVYLVVLLLIAETMNRFGDHHGEITRKIVHIGSGQVVLFAWWLSIPKIVGIAAAIAAGLIALMSYYLPILPSLESVGRRSFGTFFYAISIGLLMGFFFPEQPEYATLGILIMAWGDGLAALIGRKWGKHPYQIWGSQKSWEGSGTMTAVSFGITLLILGSTQTLNGPIVAIALFVAIIATLLETLSLWGIDNLIVPLGTAIVAWLLVG